jgi:hypothetical protein
VVIIVDPAQIGQPQVPRQRGRLSAYSLHHAAVASYRIDVEAKEGKIGLVISLGEPVAGQGHAHTCGHPLAKRTGGRFHAGSPATLRMPRTAALQLPEVLQILERHRELTECFILPVHGLHPRQVQHRIEKRGGVTGRKHEAVAIRPNRILRIKLQELLPQNIGHWSQGHRRARMAGVRLLDRIHA